MAASSFRARRGPDALRDYVRKRLPLKVIEADQRRDRLTLSEKAAARQLRRRGGKRPRPSSRKRLA